MLPLNRRLKKRKEFAYIYKQGKAAHSNILTIVSVSSKKEVSRIGISVSNKVGNAPVRNKVKRRLREIIRQKLSCLKPYVNMVIIAKEHAAGAEFGALVKDVDYLLQKAQLVNIKNKQEG